MMKLTSISGPSAEQRPNLSPMSKGLDGEARERYPRTGAFLAGRLRDQFAAEELDRIEALVTGERVLADGSTYSERGEILDNGAILIEGMVLRVMMDADRRYIVGIHVPGDFVDLHGFALKRLDHSLVALGTVELGVVPHEGIEAMMADHPRLTRALWFATLLDAAIHRRWIQMLEQLDAPRRIAHIYCELETRLALIGRPSGRALRAPFTQSDLADMCGVSAVHANRAVSKLRETGLAEIRRGTLYTSDWDALRDYAGFDPAYLYGDGPLKLNEGWD